MTLNAEDKRNLGLMRNVFGAPKVADLIVDMDKKFGDRDSMKAVNAAFSDLAKQNIGQLKTLNTVLENNAGLAEKISANLDKDPEGFRTKFLPAIFKNPQDAVKLTQEAPKAQPQQKPAPFTKTYDQIEPLDAAAAATTAINKSKDSSPAEMQANAAKVQQASGAAAPKPSEQAGERIAAKMSQLTATPGFDDLMDRVNKNQKLNNAFKAMMASAGTEADREGFLDEALNEVHKDPNLFKKMVQGLDMKPDLADTAADMIAGDPKHGLRNIKKKMDEYGMGQEGGMGNILSKLITGFKTGGASGFLTALMEVFQTIMGRITGEFQKGDHLKVATNDPGQYDEAKKATNATPNSVTSIDPSTGQLTTASNTSTGTAAPEKPKAPATTAPQQGQPG